MSAVCGTVSGLSPGTRYEITAQGYRGRFSGPPYVTVAATAGRQLAAVTNFSATLSPHSGTLVKLSWRPPATDGAAGAGDDVSPLPLQYGVFWGTSMEELYGGSVRQRTVETSTQVSSSVCRPAGRAIGESCYPGPTRLHRVGNRLDDNGVKTTLEWWGSGLTSSGFRVTLKN